MVLGTGLTADSARAAAPASLAGFTLGVTEFRVNLPGGRHPNVAESRAVVVRADGTGRRELAVDLDAQPDTWTQFAGWSPDGRVAVVLVCSNNPTNAAWEEEHRSFRHTEGWLVDTLLMNLQTGLRTNLTAIERVSSYNSGLFFWPDDPQRLGFTALIRGVSHPFSMNLDGSGKRDLSTSDAGFTYGFEASPDGRRVSYHKDYQVYLARADGQEPRHIETGNPFNFAPRWSPDGQWLLFVSGEHYNCHPTVVRADGTGLRRLADRGGYRGVVEILDVPDFHGGSSDVPVWSKEGQWVFYTAKVGDRIELMRVSLAGVIEQMTRSEPGVRNYHPVPSPDGRWLCFGSTRKEGRRQLFVMPAEGGEARQVTQVPAGWAAMHAHWQPQPRQ